MPRKILLFGAGKSASYLIKYFINKNAEENWTLTVADSHVNHLETLFPRELSLQAIELSVDDEALCRNLIASHDLVISLLPAFLHIKIAQWCLLAKKSLVTASYIDDAMKKMDSEVKKNDLVFINEAGLDPGIDHLSAMEIIHDLKEKGAEILSFESYTGGLVAPESDNNPWHYKFSWNPRNVVLAGQGSSARYLSQGEYKYVSYPQLFKTTTAFDLGDKGHYEGYPNRDSLKYRKPYGLDTIPGMLRGTLRAKGFSKAWNVFVQLGLTDDSYIMELPRGCSKRTFFNSFLPYDNKLVLEEKLKRQLGNDISDNVMTKLRYLGLFSHEEMLTTRDKSPAGHLQAILEDKWKLAENDKDLVVMIHRFQYRLNGSLKQLESSLVLEGENSTYTAMAKTVGLPAAIAAKLVLNGEITERGVLMPLSPEWYKPILNELKSYGIRFENTTTDL